MAVPSTEERYLRKSYGDVAEGPLGFRTTSETARLIEATLKEVPADLRSKVSTIVDGEIVEGYTRISTKDLVDVSETDRTDKSLVTTESLDKDREVVLADGVDIKQFMKNPIVTWGHHYHELPIGRCLWIAREKSADPKRNGWMAKTKYHEAPPGWQGPWFPDAVWSLIKQRALNGKSVGILPREMRYPTEKDIKARPELAQPGCYVISKCLLLEYCVAVVPVNPDALVTAVEKCKGIPGLAKAVEDLGMYVPELFEGRQNEEPEEPEEPELPNKKGIVIRRSLRGTVLRSK